jgi:hypothetical protein
MLLGDVDVKLEALSPSEKRRGLSSGVNKLVPEESSKVGVSGESSK